MLRLICPQTGQQLLQEAFLDSLQLIRFLCELPIALLDYVHQTFVLPLVLLQLSEQPLLFLIGV